MFNLLQSMASHVNCLGFARIFQSHQMMVLWYTFVGEMVVGPRKTLFMDEISTGLDSSTTFQIVKCMRNFVHQLDGTVFMALLQPAPETFDLFDDLVLLSDGYLMYQGPRADVVEFFESLGFQLPPRKGVADFLQEVSLYYYFIKLRVFV